MDSPQENAQLKEENENQPPPLSRASVSILLLYGLWLTPILFFSIWRRVVVLVFRSLLHARIPGYAFFIPFVSVNVSLAIFALIHARKTLNQDTQSGE